MKRRPICEAVRKRSSLSAARTSMSSLRGSGGLCGPFGRCCQRRPVGRRTRRAPCRSPYRNPCRRTERRDADAIGPVVKRAALGRTRAPVQAAGRRSSPSRARGPAWLHTSRARTAGSDVTARGAVLYRGIRATTLCAPRTLAWAVHRSEFRRSRCVPRHEVLNFHVRRQPVRRRDRSGVVSAAVALGDEVALDPLVVLRHRQGLRHERADPRRRRSRSRRRGSSAGASARLARCACAGGRPGRRGSRRRRRSAACPRAGARRRRRPRRRSGGAAG